MVELSSLTVGQLRQLAGHIGVDLSGANRKDEIVASIRAVDEATLSTRTNAVLKEALDLLDVSKSGTKSELVARVLAAVSGASAPPVAPNPAPTPARRFPWRTVGRAVATIAVVALLVWGLLALGRYAIRAHQARLRIPEATAAEAESVAESVVALREEHEFTLDSCQSPEEGFLLSVEESRLNETCVYFRFPEAPAPAEVSPPEPVSELTSTEIVDTEVFTYTPGGPNYAWPNEGAVEELEGGWTRIRQAANGEYLPWTFQVRVVADASLEDVAQWDSATKLLLTNPTTETIRIRVELRRDFEVEEAYDQAQPGDLGLGWFITGSLTKITVGDKIEELKGLGVFQMSFPRDWEGTWEINLEMDPGAQVTLNQGARRTSTDNWPLPAD